MHHGVEFFESARHDLGSSGSRSTREVVAWIETECGIVYEGRSGLIALLHRLGMEHRKPKAVSRKLGPDRQAAFIKAYENLLNQFPADEAVMFVDAVHPMHAVRPVGCWAPKDAPIAIAQTSGRQRLDVHGTIDLETGKTRMLDLMTVNAVSYIPEFIAVEAHRYPRMEAIARALSNGASGASVGIFAVAIPFDYTEGSGEAYLLWPARAPA